MPCARVLVAGAIRSQSMRFRSGKIGRDSREWSLEKGPYSVSADLAKTLGVTH